MELTWHYGGFADLAAVTVYQLLELRSRVFVVEQNCVYNDMDGLDLGADHLWAQDAARIVAALRVLPAGVKYPEIAIGRVVVDADYRKHGLGRELMTRALARTGGHATRVQAQAYLEKFYASLGYRSIGAQYEEDGILHVDMVRPAGS
jgi:ElaA protein